jgi:nucleoside-diphosphate-sugar epimerase
MTFLVTGGTGFLGSAFVRRLVERGEKVRVIDNDVRGRAERLSSVADRIDLVRGDVRDLEDMRRACKGARSVWHFAMINGTEFFYSHPDVVVEVAVMGTMNAIKAAMECGVRELVVASSSEAYASPPVVPTPETVPLSIPDPSNPRFSYGASKAMAEVMCFSYARAFERTMVFRPHNVYGPDMGWEHVIPQFTVRLATLLAERAQGSPQTAAASPDAAIPFPIQGDGSETRSFVHVDDFTDGLEHLLERGRDRQIYHIGSPEECTIADLAHAVARCMGVRIDLVKGKRLEGSSARRCPDISKARSELGYEPRIPLEKGLPGVVEWYRTHAGERTTAALGGDRGAKVAS